MSVAAMLISVCPVCGSAEYRSVRVRPERNWIDDEGEEWLDYGVIGICKCDPRWEDARLFGPLDPFNTPR